ncbi:hypothetical protein EV191_101877 [Tamaricihabitans halophyticus]|uniref:Helix-turn-helix protein n=1 Tax=Tamaricihabitans halophyticus TaxID=1262583 RepID=A0A4R2R5A9_9PSEU|nr:hypothetical protein [Tamaricihabitans halophyticus]TCP56928.1 hypothetical protein EV191_101877 [Tamaricihabitans halophyticus]
MDGLTIGPLLRQLRTASNRSQREQTDLLSRLAGRPVTRNEVSRWENETRLLTPYWQEHHAASYDVPLEQLRDAVTRTKVRRRAARQHDPTQKRGFLGPTNGIVIPAPPEPLSDRRVGHADLIRLRERTARLRRLDNFMGGADTYDMYLAEMERTKQLLTLGNYVAELGPSVKALLAEQAQLAGWSAFDAGQHAIAYRHYMTSFSAAEEANDSVLAGNALALVAYQKTATATDGVETASASYDRARKGATPRVRALLLQRLA